MKVSRMRPIAGLALGVLVFAISTGVARAQWLPGNGPGAEEASRIGSLLIPQISKCWNPPAGNAVSTVSRVSVKFSRAGEVEGMPKIVDHKSSGAERAMDEAAIRAIRRCAPYALPAESYQTWREITITFDPEQVFYANPGVATPTPAPQLARPEPPVEVAEPMPKAPPTPPQPSKDDMAKLGMFYSLFMVAKYCAENGAGFTEIDLAGVQKEVKRISDGSPFDQAQKDSVWKIADANFASMQSQITEESCAADRRQMSFTLPGAFTNGTGAANPF